MKRSDALTPLSREHHRALVVSKRILSLAQQSESLLITYWSHMRSSLGADLKQHFEEEERGFLALLNGEFKQRFLDDHRELRTLLQRDDRDSVVRFAICLKEHVRFEERELFGWLESNYTRQLADAFLTK